MYSDASGDFKRSQWSFEGISDVHQRVSGTFGSFRSIQKAPGSVLGFQVIVSGRHRKTECFCRLSGYSRNFQELTAGFRGCFKIHRKIRVPLRDYKKTKEV